MRSHIWMVATDASDARQLTFSERGESAPQWSPDGKLIGFVSARGTATGDEGPRAQIWILPPMVARPGNSRQPVTASLDSHGRPTDSRIAYLTTDSLSRDAEAKAKRKTTPRNSKGNMRLSHVWVVNVTSKAQRKFPAVNSRCVEPRLGRQTEQTRADLLPTTLIRDERRDGGSSRFANASSERIAVPSGMTIQGTPAWSH
jgi:dipeptidyl aminopeptidase/acylaminoacyl peptidase